MGCSGGRVKENKEEIKSNKNKTKEVKASKAETDKVIKAVPKINTSGFITMNKEFPNYVYTCLNFLGQGGFSSAFKVKHNKTGEIRAAKNFQRDVLDMQEGDKTIPREIEIQRVISHPHICKAYEWFDYPDGFVLVTEMLEGGNLVNLLEKYKYLTEPEVAEIMKQLLSAIYYLHSNKIMHRDLKLNNIMVEFDDDRNFSIKVIDFGLADYFVEGQKCNQLMGTPLYMAPEVINNDYDHLCDIWSCGVIMYMLLIGEHPWGYFYDLPELYSRIQNAPLIWDGLKKLGLSDSAIDLMSKMMERNVGNRYTALMCLQHPFLANIPKNVTNESANMEQVSKNLRKFMSGNELQQATSAFIMYHYENTTKNKQLKELFKEMDNSGDGRLTKAELQKGFEKIFKGEPLMKDFAKIFGQINTDGSDYVDYNEFIRACASMDDAISESMIKEAFDHFDADKSGHLEIEELKKALGFVNGTEEEMKVLKEVIAQSDMNKDGKISFEEFKNLILKVNEKKQ